MKKYTSTITRLLFSTTARNTYMVFFGNLLSAFFAFLFTVAVVRKLSYSQFGYFSALLSFQLLISELSDIGIGQSLSSFLPKLDDERKRMHGFLKTAFILQLAVISAVTAVLITLSGFFSDVLFHNILFTGLVKLTSAGIFFTVMSNFVLFALSAKQKFTAVSVLTLTGSVIRLAFFYILIYLSLVNLDNTVTIQTLSLGVLLLISLAV